jgi:lipopolysaccharide transport system ATP-binding protein
MFMRLAFATAISVDPDILIIDEALAVGDARFQQKCYAKFKEFQESGKTIILVTHDRFTVGKLCDEAILLDKGQIIANGEVQYVMNCYEELLAEIDSELLEKSEDNAGLAINLKNRGNFSSLNSKDGFFSKEIDKNSILKNPTYNTYERRFGNNAVEIIDYLLISNSLLNQSTIESGSEVELYLKVLHHKLIGNLNYGISIFTKDGILVHGINTFIKNIHPPSLGENGLSIYKITMKLLLSPGDYFISPAIADGSEILCDVRQQAIHIRIFDKLAYTGILNMPSAFETVDEGFIDEN